METKIKCLYHELLPLSELKPHPANRNTHPPKQVEVLSRIIAKNGQRAPIVISNLSGFINKGHCRYEAVKLLGWETVAVEYQDYDNEEDELRDRIADNEIARYAEFDHSNFMEDIGDIDVNPEDVDFEMYGLINYTPYGLVDEVNKGSENDEWVDMPEFEKGNKDVKIIIHFDTELEREIYAKDNNLEADRKQSNQWIIHK